jgi:hypothetical protein
MKTKSGFTLLIAMIFVGVVLAFAATLGALGYKQSVLAGNAIQSQYAFYAADAGLECVLDDDQQNDLFDFSSYVPPGNPIVGSCNGAPVTYDTLSYSAGTGISGDNGYWVLQTEGPGVAAATSSTCAQMTIYKYESTQADGKTTYLFSQGYNLPCSKLSSGGTRLVARGLEAAY